MKLLGIDVLSGQSIRVEVAEGVAAAVEVVGGAGQQLAYLAPGLIDIQVNGYRGLDYSAEDFEAGHLELIAADLAAAGVVRHFPTIITGPRERVLRNLGLIARVVGAGGEPGAAVAGIHLEGPYICPEDGPRGAHDREFVRDPDWEEFSRWQEAAEGLIRLVTLAPERPGALEFIRRAVAAGVRVALGHTQADATTIARAVQAGASLSTHLGNGSHALMPRLRNYIWEQLACDELWASIITDGFHLPDSVIRSFWRSKGPGRVILTSDVAVMGGKPPGVYRWGGIEVEVFADGHLGLAGTEYLAGAAHLLDWDIPRCVAASGCSLAEAIAACTVNPARYFALPEGPDVTDTNGPPRSGLPGAEPRPLPGLRPGIRADLVQFRWAPGDQRLQIECTLRGGRTVYSAV